MFPQFKVVRVVVLAVSVTMVYPFVWEQFSSDNLSHHQSMLGHITSEVSHTGERMVIGDKDSDVTFVCDESPSSEFGVSYSLLLSGVFDLAVVQYKNFSYGLRTDLELGLQLVHTGAAVVIFQNLSDGFLVQLVNGQGASLFPWVFKEGVPNSASGFSHGIGYVGNRHTRLVKSFGFCPFFWGHLPSSAMANFFPALHENSDGGGTADPQLFGDFAHGFSRLVGLNRVRFLFVGEVYELTHVTALLPNTGPQAWMISLFRTAVNGVVQYE